MNDQRADDPSRLQRQKRLELQMKENLKRRKAQARARRDVPSDTGAAPQTPEDAPGERDD